MLLQDVAKVDDKNLLLILQFPRQGKLRELISHLAGLILMVQCDLLHC